MVRPFRHFAHLAGAYLCGFALCAQVPIAPSTYYEHKAREGEPERAPSRVRRDGWLCGSIRRVYDEHFGVYGVRKVWRQLRREGVAVARCTVARLMRRLGLQGAVRGRRTKTTHSVVQGERPDDRVNREFKVSTRLQLCPLRWLPDADSCSGCASISASRLAQRRTQGGRHRRVERLRGARARRQAQPAAQVVGARRPRHPVTGGRSVDGPSSPAGGIRRRSEAPRGGQRKRVSTPV